MPDDRKPPCASDSGARPSPADPRPLTGAANTRRAYTADWRHFSGWCRREGLEALPPAPQTVALYIAACASGARSVGGRRSAISTIERRLSALVWACAQRGLKLDRRHPQISTVLADLRDNRAAPGHQKAALRPEDIRAMLETCDRGSLRGLRDRAMLLLGFAGGLRRSEITGLDAGRDQTGDGRGWVKILPDGILVTLRSKIGLREVEIDRNPTDAACPVAALEAWLKLARIGSGPLFRRVTGRGREVGPTRLNDREVARLVKRAVISAGIRGDLPESARAALFSGRSLHPGKVTDR